MTDPSSQAQPGPFSMSASWTRLGGAKDHTVICPDGSNGYSFPAGTVVKGDLVVPAGLYCSPLEVKLKG